VKPQMQKKIAIIQNQKGLHARASVKFVEVVNKFRSSITVSKCGKTVSGHSIMGLMMLAASKGTKIDIRAKGEDSKAAIDAICKLVKEKFYED